MKRTLSVLLIALSLLVPFTVQAAPANSASAVVQNFYNQLTDTMKQGETLGFSGRYKKLEPAVKEAFDMPFMARVAVGPAWQQTSSTDQQKLIDAFANFSVANYASQFKKYDGETFTITGEKPATGGGIIVETQLKPRDGEPVSLNYLVRTNEKGQPKIVDVFLDGSISQLATRRSEFSAIIKREGIGALISSLYEKAKNMSVT